MPDNRIYDAINVFKYSPTGRGTSNIGGDAAYQAKYRRLAAEVVDKLWSLWSADEIGWTNLGANTIGDSRPRRNGFDIRVTTSIEPPNSAAAFQNAHNQGKLAATSCNLVHEATHLVREIDSYPEEELLCRTIQLFYFRDLKSSRSYQSRVASTHCLVQYLPTTPFYNDYQSRLTRLRSQELIDTVMAFAAYRNGRGGDMTQGGLESDATARFIARSLSWWGGLSNRWPSTRGYYLRSLASREGQDFAYSLLEILESLGDLTLAPWRTAKSYAGDLQRIRRGLAAGNHMREFEFTNRINSVQRALHEDFGIHSP